MCPPLNFAINIHDFVEQTKEKWCKRTFIEKNITQSFLFSDNIRNFVADFTMSHCHAPADMLPLGISKTLWVKKAFAIIRVQPKA